MFVRNRTKSRKSTYNQEKNSEKKTHSSLDVEANTFTRVKSCRMKFVRILEEERFKIPKNEFKHMRIEIPDLKQFKIAALHHRAENDIPKPRSSAKIKSGKNAMFGKEKPKNKLFVVGRKEGHG